MAIRIRDLSRIEPSLDPIRLIRVLIDSGASHQQGVCPVRRTASMAMNASFLRASRFTLVVAFGVASVESPSFLLEYGEEE